MKNNLITYGVLALFIFFAGCKKDSTDKPDGLKFDDLTNLKYGDHASQSLDIYLPENRSGKTKMIVFVHGGFWIGGDKAEFTELAKSFRDKGYASASINYRLLNTAENNIHPAQINDLAKALSFLQSKTEEWSISKSEVALIGASAGGHIALLYTYAYDTGNNVKTVVSLAGPTDLSDLRNASPQQSLVLQSFLGASPQTNPAIYRQASPITHVSAGSKPTLLFHGKLDVVVPYQQSVNLKAKLDQFSVKNKLVLYDNLGHEVNLNAIPGFIVELESWLSANL